MADPIPQVNFPPADQPPPAGPPSPYFPPYSPPYMPDPGSQPNPGGGSGGYVPPDTTHGEYNPYTPLPHNMPSPDVPNYTTPQPGAPSYTDAGNVSPYFSMVGGIWGGYRRRFVKSKLTKSLEQAARRGLDAIFRAPPGSSSDPGELSPAMKDALTRAVTPRGQPTPKVFFQGPPPEGPGGSGIGYGAIFRALVPGVTGLVGLVGLLYPRGMFGPNAERSDVGYGNPFQRYIDEYGALLAAGRAREQDRNLELLRPPGQLAIRESGLFPTEIPRTTHRPSRVQRFTNRLERFEQRFAEVRPGEIIPLLVNRGPNAGGYVYPGDSGFTPLPEGEKMRGITYPVFDTRPEPGEVPAPAPSSPGKIKRQGPTGAINWPKFGVFAGATVGGIYLLRQLVGGNPYAGGLSVAPISAPVPGPAPAPAPPGTGPAPNIGSFAVGSYGGSYGGSVGDCGCGPRGPRRKCLERAPVAWRSGRNKGKAAGSKCVRYAQRAT